MTEPWPDLNLSTWEGTRDTVHMWTRIVGKVRLALEPPLNHWWQVTLYVSARGLTTGLMPVTGSAHTDVDLATTRFSGRPAPLHPGGAPNCADWVMQEAYSHDVSSCGFWPGGSEEGSFYSYAYPEPDGFRAAPVTPAAAL